jgi:hypothetical protein
MSFLQMLTATQDPIRYEGHGLSLYEAITNYPPYYLYTAEHSIVKKYGDEIVSSLPRQVCTLIFLPLLLGCILARYGKKPSHGKSPCRFYACEARK